MDAQLKAEWVSALRSGEYTQERDSIGSKHAKHLCCLGVGACVADPNVELVVTSDAIAALEPFGVTGYVGDAYSPLIVELIKLNDRDGKSFAEIADYIEANIPADASTPERQP